MFVNRINLRPKQHEFESVFTIKEGVEEEAIFLIEHSVFQKYECEQLPGRVRYLQRGFEHDMKYSKMSRVCKADDNVLLSVNKAIWDHYDTLNNIWLFECGHTGAPQISWNDFTYWCKKNGILDNKVISLADFDRTFILTNVNTHGYFSSAERNLNRYEFLEILVRFAKMKYMETV